MIKLGLCITGSFCTHKALLNEIPNLINHGYDVTPIFSFNVDTLSTRFFAAEDFKREIIRLTGKVPVCSLPDAEPLGTKRALDIMVVAPCTGNTCAKIANGITDTPVTLAVKAHLRNDRPLVISISTNDALHGNAKNIGMLLNTKNVFFVPFGQDDPAKKPNSLVADMAKLSDTCDAALESRQIQPLILSKTIY